MKVSHRKDPLLWASCHRRERGPFYIRQWLNLAGAVIFTEDCVERVNFLEMPQLVDPWSNAVVFDLVTGDLLERFREIVRRYEYEVARGRPGVKFREDGYLQLTDPFKGTGKTSIKSCRDFRWHATSSMEVRSPVARCLIPGAIIKPRKIIVPYPADFINEAHTEQPIEPGGVIA